MLKPCTLKNVRDMIDIYEPFNRLTSTSFSEPVYGKERMMA